jgi:hypothetical protein
MRHDGVTRRTDREMIPMITRCDMSFRSDGQRCAGWLFLPAFREFYEQRAGHDAAA